MPQRLPHRQARPDQHPSTLSSGATRRRLRGRCGFVLALALVAVLPLGPVAPAGAQVPGPRPVPPPVLVVLSAAGFAPNEISLTVGQSLVIENTTGADRRITAADGSVDSSAIPPGSRFAVAFPSARIVNLADDATGEGAPHTATVNVGLLELEGNPDSPIAIGIGIPDIPPSPALVDPHPTLGVRVARNRVVLSFAPGATIGQVNAALAAAGLTVVGGHPRFGVLVTELAGNPTPADPTTLQVALDAARAMPGIGAAAYDIALARENSLPRPAVPDPGEALGAPYKWDGLTDAEGVTRGEGGNWGLESSRFPQAWNGLDLPRQREFYNEQLPDTVVLDSGFFADHPDLVGATVHGDLCATTSAGPSCTTNDTSADAGSASGPHGTATAGIIGAAFDRGPDGLPTSQGTVGANPMAKLHLVPWTDSAPVVGTSVVNFYEFATELDLILDAKTARFPNLRVINISAGPVALTDDGQAWMAAWGNKTCGIDSKDDETAPPEQRAPCSPANEDTFFKELHNYSQMYAGIGTQLASSNILLVSSAGNENALLCPVFPIPTGGCPDFIDMPAWAVNPFAYLDRRANGASPFIDVEAHTKQLKKAAYSNIGLVSAPADGNVVPRKNSDGTFGWTTFSGTSAAAPYVAALVGLLAAFQPEINGAQIKTAILSSTLDDIDGGAPRIDAYAALLQMPRGLTVMLDASDPSLDGNRRVIYDDAGKPLGLDTTKAFGAALHTAPDHKVDIRDFRRFRDAYLAFCSEGDPGCPPLGQVALDGPENHPKKDTNLDRCFFGAGSPCDYAEGWYNRFDFNGDGTLLPRAVFTPIHDDGSVVAPGFGTDLTDLGVLKLEWPADAGADLSATGGWSADDLDKLLSSADVEVRLDGLWEQGAEQAEVTVQSLTHVTPPQRFGRAVTPGDNAVMTIPVEFFNGETPDIVQVRVSSWMPGDDVPREYLSDYLTAKAGQDLVVKPCTDQLAITAAPPRPVIGGQSTIEATLVDCLGHGVADREIEFQIESGPNGSSISEVTAMTDASGVARTIYSNPIDGNGPAVIHAIGQRALQGEHLIATVELDPAPDLTVHYRFRQTILDYQRESTNDWGAGKDDCDSPGEVSAPRVEFNCFSAVQTLADPRWVGDWFYDPGLPTMEREGTITPNGSGGATVTERARIVGVRDGNIVDTQSSFKTVVTEWKPGDPGSSRTRVYDSWAFLTGQDEQGGEYGDDFTAPVTVDIPEVHFVITDSGLDVVGLDHISKTMLEAHEIGSLRRGVLIDTLELHPDVPIRRFTPLSNHPPELTLGPRSDETAFKYDRDGEPLRFLRDASGNYQQIKSYCAVVDDGLTNAEGYWNDIDPQLTPTIRDTNVNRATREAGDRAAPTHDGGVLSKYEFAASLTFADGAPLPRDFPTFCPDETPPIDIAWTPNPVNEGDEVQLFDVSEYATTAIEHNWDFGDGETSTEASPKHVFEDDLAYPVDLELVDPATGPHVAPTHNIVVNNVDPSLALVGIAGTPSAPKLQIEVDDASPIDRMQLTVHISSPTPGFPTVAPQYVQPDTDANGEFVPGAFVRDMSFPSNIAPGMYFVVVKVTDKDDGAKTATFSLSVAPPPAVTQTESLNGSSNDAGTESMTFQATDAGSPLIELRVAQPEPVPVVTTSKSRSGERPVGGPVAEPMSVTNAVADPTPVPAFVIDRTTAATGDLVVVRNATRADGSPTAASVNPGDGRPAVAIAAGDTVELSWLAGGTFNVVVAGGEVQAAVDVAITGPPVPPTITSQGPPSGAQGSLAPVAALVTKPGGLPVEGVAVRFTLNGTSVDATTGPDGLALANLAVTGDPGPSTLTITVLPDHAIEVAFEIVANNAPVANAGGPYKVASGAPLALVGTATDADVNEQNGLSFQWDLDADGAFDDATGPQPGLTAEQVQAFVCDGVCDAGDVGQIVLRVTDPKGGVGTASSTITLIRDFGLSVSPSNALLVPNSSVSFLVDVSTINGFDQPVALSTVGLPSGVSSYFQPSSVTPNGSSVLTVTAGANISNQSFDLVVRGTSGDLVRESSASIDLEFGLVPVCNGTVTGHITDVETGLGLPGVYMFGELTDDAGYYFADGVQLGTGNAATTVGQQVGTQGYYNEYATGIVGCGIVTTIDADLLRQRFGAVEGNVTGLSADGTTPLGPVAGAKVFGATADANGHYLRENLALGSDNGPRTYGMGAGPPEGAMYHWSPNVNVTVSAGEIAQQDFVLREVCTASVYVQVIDARTKQPLPYARVENEIADAQGVAQIDGYWLAPPDNGPKKVGVDVYTPDGVSPGAGASKQVTIAFCGGVTPVTIELSRPHDVLATIDVEVVDDETGEPIANAGTRINGLYFGSTDDTGHVSGLYRLGVDVPPDKDVFVAAGHADYWPLDGATVTLHEGQTTSVTLRLMPRRSGWIEGTVRDKETGAPLQGMVVSTGAGGGYTGPDGRYRFQVPLGPRNTPVETSVQAYDQAQPPTHWRSESTPVTIAGDATATQDLTMLEICASATIRGRVVSAVSGEPLPDASVGLYTTSGAIFDSTDAEGLFVLDDVPIGDQNTSATYSVQASKSGFISASKTVTVFCGATIVVDFGGSESSTGAIAGKVTGPGGTPVAGAFVGTEFGGSDTTDANGVYSIAQAPLGAGDAARDWAVTVTPPAGSGLIGQTKTATVQANTTTPLDFQLLLQTNRAPSAVDLAYVTERDVPVAVALSGSDPDGDALTFTVVSPPAYGVLSGTPPLLTYTPTAGYTGGDTFTYTASDGDLTSLPATMSITVAPPNQAPVAVITPAAGTTAEEDSSIELGAAMSTDADGEIVSYEWDTDGDGLYDNFNGPTAYASQNDDGSRTVGLRVTDNDGASSTSSIVVTFTNVAPVVEVADSSLTVPTGFPVTNDAWFDDPGDDEWIGAVDWADGAGPQLFDVDAGQLSHVYASPGTYTVTVRVCDDDGGCGTTTFTVLVTGVGPTTTTTTTVPTTTTTTTTVPTTTTTVPATTTTTVPTTTTTTVPTTTTTTVPTTTTTTVPMTSTTTTVPSTTSSTNSTSTSPSTTTTAPTTTTTEPGTTTTTEPGSTTTTTAPDQPGLTVSPTVLGPGDPFTVRSTGWLPASSVQVSLHSTPVVLGTVVVDESGTVNATFTVPTGFELGQHTVQLDGTGMSGLAQSLGAGIEVVAHAATSTSNAPAVTAPTGAAPTATGSLPVTGSSLWALPWAFVLMSVGLALLAARRKRRFRWRGTCG